MNRTPMLMHSPHSSIRLWAPERMASGLEKAAVLTRPNCGDLDEWERASQPIIAVIGDSIAETDGPDQLNRQSIEYFFSSFNFRTIHITMLVNASCRNRFVLVCFWFVRLLCFAFLFVFVLIRKRTWRAWIHSDNAGWKVKVQGVSWGRSFGKDVHALATPDGVSASHSRLHRGVGHHGLVYIKTFVFLFFSFLSFFQFPSSSFIFIFIIHSFTRSFNHSFILSSHLSSSLSFFSFSSQHKRLWKKEKKITFFFVEK